jgi:hypothetical protein
VNLVPELRFMISWHTWNSARQTVQVIVKILGAEIHHQQPNGTLTKRFYGFQLCTSCTSTKQFFFHVNFVIFSYAEDFFFHIIVVLMMHSLKNFLTRMHKIGIVCPLRWKSTVYTALKQNFYEEGIVNSKVINKIM